MAVRIYRQLCNGCGGADEPNCVRVCPGNLLYQMDGKTAIRSSMDCWDCAACIKACPRQAIAMYLPTAVGGRGATLKARAYPDRTVWICTRPDGDREIFELPATGAGKVNT
ncbi:adenylylsulfate reductase [Clostridiales bacterium PH28_bin88]|nr:adenylylsulfate reductase [Clostridiales bacterium PH28_bin88]